jgi:hypothetical protein
MVITGHLLPKRNCEVPYSFVKWSKIPGTLQRVIIVFMTALIWIAGVTQIVQAQWLVGGTALPQ